MKDGFPTFTETAEIVVKQVISNYLFDAYDSRTKALIHSEIVSVLSTLWKGIEFRVAPNYYSYGMSFAIRIELDVNDPIFVHVDYSWG